MAALFKKLATVLVVGVVSGMGMTIGSAVGRKVVQKVS